MTTATDERTAAGPTPKPERERDDHVVEHAVGSRKDRQMLRRLIAFARPHRGALLITVVLLVSGLGLRLTGPELIQRAIDGPVQTAIDTRGTDAFDSGALLDQVKLIAGLFLVVALATALLQVFRERLMARTGQRIVLTMRSQLFGHVLRLPVGWFDRNHVGWIVTRSTSDVDALSEVFTTGLATIAYDILTIFVVIGMLFWIAPELATVAVLILPLMVFVSFRFRLKARMAFRATRKSLSRLNVFLQERLTGLDVVHLFRREADSQARFEQLNQRYYDDNLVTVRHFSLFFPTVDVLSTTVKMGSLVWGGWLVSQNRLHPGVFIQFWIYLDYVFEPIRELAERYNVLQAAMAAAERVFGILDVEPEDVGAAMATTAGPVAQGQTANGQAAPDPDTAIAFEGVSFAYGDGPRVLQDVSFRIATGERVAVVGHTGAGKTTLASLLLRFHEIEHGTIRLHGVDTKNIRQGTLRSRIAIVQQDVFLFSDTVAANIKMGTADMPETRVRAMAEAVRADTFVDRLPQRYETVLAERGANLSSGQRQLLAFARALAADPEVLILDEATSSVDSETEALIESATATLMKGRTSLVIAHRLSTVVNADRILVMHKGRLHEEGTHDELLAARGLYHKLYHLHLAGAAS